MELSAKSWMHIFWGYQYITLVIDEMTLYSNSIFVYIYFAISTLAQFFIILYWFLADAKENNYYPTRLFKVLVFIFSFITIPYYLVKIKGWSRAGVSFSKFLIYTIFLLMFYYAADYTGIFRIA